MPLPLLLSRFFDSKDLELLDGEEIPEEMDERVGP